MKKRCISFNRNLLIAVFCTFTAFSHCLFGYASNDDEYITFNTAETIQAYQYFYRYGFTGDTSYTYTDTYTTNGSINLGNVNISLSSNGSIGGSGTSVSSFEGMWHSFVGTGEDTYTLDISQTNIATVNPTNTTPSHLTLACTFTTTSGGYLTGGSCSDPSFTDIGRYNVTLNAGNDVVTITGSRADTYAIFRSTANPNYDSETNSDLSMYTADSFSGSLSFNSSGGLSGSGSISATTTTTNTNKLNYVLPWISASTISNPSITNTNSSRPYAWNYRKNNPFIISFFSNKYISNSNALNFTVYKWSDNTVYYTGSDVFKISGRNSYSPNTGGMYLIHIETKEDLSLGNSLHYIYYESNPFGNVIPLYVGYKDNISDSMYRFLYGSDRIIESLEKQTNIIENGNSNSQNKGQQLDTKTDQMQTQMTTFQNIEDTASDNMNAALQNININPSLISNNKFLVSVDWIRQQYNRIVNNTPFEAVITFCLVFGLGLLLLGKVR